MRSEITGTQVEKPSQYRVIVVIPVIYSEGQYRQICDSDIKGHLPYGGIYDTGSYHGSAAPIYHCADH